MIEELNNSLFNITIVKNLHFLNQNIGTQFNNDLIL